MPLALFFELNVDFSFIWVYQKAGYPQVTPYGIHLRYAPCAMLGAANGWGIRMVGTVQSLFSKRMGFFSVWP
jgi:hypothetical protein